MWPQIGMCCAGIWLMAAPGIFDFSGKIADNAHIAGPLIASFALIAAWECTRNVRLFNLPVAAWLLISPWVLDYSNPLATANDYGVALAVFLLSRVRIERKHRFGGGWPAVWRSGTPDERNARNF